MAHTFHQLYIHAVFAVKYRHAVIAKEWKPRLLSTIGNLINETHCKAIIVNGVEDHVHCLFGLRPAVSVSDLMRITKARSSKYINDHSLTVNRFEWQVGYGAFSLGRNSVNRVYHYIKNQEAHHMKESFQAEYRRQLDEFRIGYEENYIFSELI